MRVPRFPLWRWLGVGVLGEREGVGVGRCLLGLSFSDG